MTIALLLTSLLVSGQVKEDRLKGQLEILENKQITIVVDNIFGAVDVAVGKENAVTYDVLKTISGDTEGDRERGFAEVEMEVIQRNDSIIFYLKAPFICDQWSGCYPCGKWIKGPQGYDFQFDYSLRVPAAAHLSVQTVDRGGVSIEGITGTVSAENVNGEVKISGAHEVSRATTVNGDVEVWFEKCPTLDGTFSTINGTISLYCSAAFNASITAKTMQGSLYTAFDFETKKPVLKKVMSMDGATATYQINETLGIEIGRDGPLLSFETLTGDIYLRKQ